MRVRIFVLIGLLAAQASVAPAVHSAAGDVDAAFNRTWVRTDYPVAQHQVDRTWMWGPGYITSQRFESYEESSGGVRAVLYLDKARMEVTTPDADPQSPWYVTNGLLVVELVTGRMQTGNTRFETRSPATVNVAGDGDDPAGPTYATFGPLRSAAAIPEGSTINQRVNREGAVTADSRLAERGVIAAHLVSETRHTVAAPFWSFMNSTGTVYENGSYVTGLLFQNPFYATGLPITEAYWATVRVGGTPKDVLMQCFERRCLTYTPDNPDGWKVEAGNVGLHYYIWRYGYTPRNGQIMFVQNDFGWSRIHTMKIDGSDNKKLTYDETPDLPEHRDELQPELSPDGRLVAYDVTYDRNKTFHIFVMNSDGSNPHSITSQYEGSFWEPHWSPDGSHIVVAGNIDGAEGTNKTYIMNADGSDLRWWDLNGGGVTWSPDGNMIAYTCTEYAHICLANADGTGHHVLLEAINSYGAFWIKWSPDGQHLAFTTINGDMSQIYVMNVDGSNVHLLVTQDAAAPSWSPDGNQIAFYSYVPNDCRRIFAVYLEGVMHFRQAGV